jgi:hypothetical protein
MYRKSISEHFDTCNRSGTHRNVVCDGLGYTERASAIATFRSTFAVYMRPPT